MFTWGRVAGSGRFQHQKGGFCRKIDQVEKQALRLAARASRDKAVLRFDISAAPSGNEQRGREVKSRFDPVEAERRSRALCDVLTDLVTQARARALSVSLSLSVAMKLWLWGAKCRNGAFSATRQCARFLSASKDGQVPIGRAFRAA
ncbi:hypothetical protein [Asaia platycodi]|uniref:hypothetical protein n=1 Tax=Asaia platycodi TaxID=610243 RepID=UPI0004706C06|nr:hypothetical protein [Asaia platycodi]